MELNWNIASIIRLIWRQRTVVAVAVVASMLLSLVYMHLASPAYTISLQLVPAPSSGQRQNGFGALSALAGLAGKGGDAGGGFQTYLAGLQSYAAAELIARDQKVMRQLYKGQWSEREHRWRQPVSLLHFITGPIKAILGIGQAWQPPSADMVYVYLRDAITVTQSRDSPVVTVSIISSDPHFAQQFLLQLANGVDQLLRARALQRSNQYIEYLQAEMQKVTVTEYRAALLENLSDQEKNRMIASAKNVSYAADVFSGPMVSPGPTSPSLAKSLLLAVLFGFLAGFVVAIYLDAHRKIFVLPVSFSGLKQAFRSQTGNDDHPAASDPPTYSISK